MCGVSKMSQCLSAKKDMGLSIQVFGGKVVLLEYGAVNRSSTDQWLKKQQCLLWIL